MLLAQDSERLQKEKAAAERKLESLRVASVASPVGASYQRGADI